MRRFIPFAIPSGASPAVKTQTKKAKITTNGGSVTVTPDTGYYLSSAEVTANIPTEVKTHPEITENGSYTITPTAGKLMTKATFTVNVPTGGGLPASIAAMETGSFISSSEINEEVVHVFSPSIRPDLILIYSSEVVSQNNTIIGANIATYNGTYGSAKVKQTNGTVGCASCVVSSSGNNVTIKNANASRWRQSVTYYYIIIQLTALPTAAGDPPQTGTSEPGVML